MGLFKSATDETLCRIGQLNTHRSGVSVIVHVTYLFFCIDWVFNDLFIFFLSHSTSDYHCNIMVVRRTLRKVYNFRALQ